MDGYRDLQDNAKMLRNSATAIHEEEKQLLGEILDLAADIGRKTKRLKFLSAHAGVTDLDNQRALSWLDENLADLSATVIGIARSHGGCQVRGQFRRAEHEEY